MIPENIQFTAFLITSVMAMAGFIVWLVKKVIKITEENTTASRDLKHAVCNNTEATKDLKQVIQNINK